MKLQYIYFRTVPSLNIFLCDGLIKDTHHPYKKLNKELWGTHN
jgi:hypothetical protein